MGFTINCDTCGTAQKFTEFSMTASETESVAIHVRTDRDGEPVDVTFCCKNPNCKKFMDVPY